MSFPDYEGYVAGEVRHSLSEDARERKRNEAATALLLECLTKVHGAPREDIAPELLRRAG